MFKLLFTDTGSSIKIAVEWALTHHDGVKVSRGKNTVMMEDYVHSILTECLKTLNKSSTDIPGSCKQVIIPNLIPKFLVLHLKYTETAVKSEMMIHNPCKYIIFIKVSYLFKLTGEVTNYIYPVPKKEIPNLAKSILSESSLLERVI